MEKQSVKIFIACAIGSAIGGLFMASFNRHLWLVVLGLIIGGLAGYLSYQYKEVLEAAKRSYIEVHGWDWRLTPERKKELREAMFSVITTIIMALNTFIFTTLLVLMSKSVEEALREFSQFHVILLTLFLMPVCGLIISLLIEVYSKSPSMEVTAKKTILFGNPIAVFICWPLVLSVKALIKGTVKIPKVACVSGKFISNLFRLIHSEERFLCGIDSAIGSFACYLFSSWGIYGFIGGALFGGLFGVLNYELVSKRWLHLVPKGT